MEIFHEGNGRKIPKPIASSLEKIESCNFTGLVASLKIKFFALRIPQEEILGHFVSKGMRFFQGLYLKAICSKNSRVKPFWTIPKRILMTPDEIYDTHVDFNGDLDLC